MRLCTRSSSDGWRVIDAGEHGSSVAATSRSTRPLRRSAECSARGSVGEPRLACDIATLRASPSPPPAVTPASGLRACSARVRLAIARASAQ